MKNAVEIFGAVMGVSLIRYFIIAGIPFLLFYIIFKDKLERFRIQKRMAKKKDFIREIVHSSQTTVVFTVIALLIMATPLKEYTFLYSDINEYPLWWVAVSLVLALIIHDTYSYWMHRLLHHPKIYRHTHLVHHKSVTPTPWASYSFHILEAITEGLVLVPLVLLLPMHTFTVILFTVTSLIINVYGHLGYEIAPRAFRNSFLFEILNTSMHHNLHHSRFIGNYGLYFRFWDRLMKTENPDYVKEYDRMQEKRFGNMAQPAKISTEGAELKVEGSR
jgi:lathosterol oxidase